MNWNEFSCKICLSSRIISHVGTGGLLLQKMSYALHAVSITSSCGIFAQRLVTSIETRQQYLIEQQPPLKETLKEPPIISYTRGCSLKDILIRAKL